MDGGQTAVAHEALISDSSYEMRADARQKLAPVELLRPPAPTEAPSRVYKEALARLFRTLDAGLVLAAILVSYEALRGTVVWRAEVSDIAPFLFGGGILLASLRIAESYNFPRNESTLGHVLRAAAALIGGLLASFALAFLLRGPTGFDETAIALTAAALAAMALHAHYVSVVRGYAIDGRLSDNVVIVGATENAQRLIEKNAESGELNILAIFDDRRDRAPSSIGGVPVVGDTMDLLAFGLLPDVDRIIITVTAASQPRVRQLVDRLRGLPNSVTLLLDFDGLNPERTTLAEAASAPMAYVSGCPRDVNRALSKRIQDVVFGIGMLIAFSPVMLVTALAIKMDSKGPVFFRQRRHGFNNEIIKVWKFRSMRPSTEGEKIERQVGAGDDRVTRVGQFIRRTSIDELPQLFNVLAGEMSIVGPRPHAIGMRTGDVESHLLVAEYAHRHRVKPGITGWAQVNGSRGPVNTPEEVRERVRLDIEYIDRTSFWFDLWIMISTAPALLGDKENTR
ncbi:MAG: exopolysaccharide biosynthesis polyprenyl glycosylphosphotransferase [Caulobacterales bacterium]